MGHIVMPAFAFRAALSEDSGVRAGFSLTEAEMLEHLGDDHPMRAGLSESGILRVGSEEYADAVGDLLFALGATEQPGMPTLGMRMMRVLDRDWRSLFTIDEMLELEAVANHYLRLRIKGEDEQKARFAELESVARGKPGVMDALMDAMAHHLALLIGQRSRTSSIPLLLLPCI